ncbi:MAG: CpsD/CapB family tyrosine-protein kinase, partial [Acidimicrobiales bacterium]
GLILGIALAFARDFFDDTIKSRRDLERATNGSSLLGIIPIEAEWTDPSATYVALRSDPTSGASEAYRTLRTAVQFVSTDPPLKVLSITSAVLGEGKTTTVANLAISFGRAGRRVVVVDYDLRRPRLHLFFNNDNTVGLTSVLTGGATLRDAVVAVEGEPNVVFIPSGPIPDNPAELLSMDRNRTLVESLSARADVVLLDCPPVLPVSDALITSLLSDGIVLVASAGTTKKTGLQRACELLWQVEAPVIGVALNKVPISDSYQYNYGYYYSSEYSRSSSNGKTRANGSSNGKSRANGSSNGKTPTRVGQR